MGKCTECFVKIDDRKVNKQFYFSGVRGGKHIVCYKCFYTKKLINLASTATKYYIWLTIGFFICMLFFSSRVELITFFGIILLILVYTHYKSYHKIKTELQKYISMDSSFSYNSENGIHKISEVQFMDGQQFEEFCGNLFITLGYGIDYTPISNDFGVDIVAKRGGEIIAIQTKKYSNTVGVRAIQEVSAGAMHYGATKSIVITSALGFTSQAKKLAHSCNVELWSLNDLKNTIDDCYRQKNCNVLKN